MKKYLLLVTVFCLLIFCVGCGSQDSSISEYEWYLERAFYVENEKIVVEAANELSSAHPEAKIVEVQLTAQDGKIVLIDSTNNITYEGTYTVLEKNPGGTEYEITIGDITGTATVAMTTYSDGSQIPSLPVKLGKYTLQFFAK